MINLREFFAQIEATFALQMQDKGLNFSIQFELGAGESFHVDPGVLSKLMVNLTGNALKFTESGTVAILVDCQDRHLHVWVTDTGVGLADADQKQVFERFVRTEDSRVRAIDGAGIGLALCQELVERSNGEIGVERELGKGSTFWFSLPEAEA
jgi:signal transduction histidine kinase